MVIDLEPRQGNKGQDMKKIIDFGSGHLESKLSKFVDGKLDANEYKISYQPERLNPEDIRNNVSDSPTSENK